MRVVRWRKGRMAWEIGLTLIALAAYGWGAAVLMLLVAVDLEFR